MTTSDALEDLENRLSRLPRFRLAQLPTPIEQLHNFGRLLGGPKLWLKRDDLGGTPAIHAYAEQFGSVQLTPFEY